MRTAVIAILVMLIALFSAAKFAGACRRRWRQTSRRSPASA